jgi:hypothetical protein
MTDENQFGHSVSPFVVENDMMEHLKFWMPTYLGQMERESNPVRDPGSLKVVDWTTKTRFDSFPEDAIPMVIIISPGTVGKPYKQGKKWCGTWLLRITAVCSAPDEDTTRELAHLYVQAIKMAVLQYKQINNNPDVEGVDWAGDVYNLIASSETRTLAASQVVFHVAYSNVLDEGEGPAEPTAAPEAPTDPGPWPTVKEGGVNITIDKEPLDG